jgi:SAM-dependent methyltransferase
VKLRRWISRRGDGSNALPDGPDTASLQAVFQRIYREETWTDKLPGMPRSGRGALLERSLSVVAFIRERIADGSVRSIVDVGCGDLTYMSAIPEVTSGQVDYRGIDIVPELIEEHRRLAWGSFDVGDITSPRFRARADLVVVKDVLFHLTNEQALVAVDNLRASRWRWLLLTSSPTDSNKDRVFDHWHWAPLNVTLPPFSLRSERALERPDGGAFLVFGPDGLVPPTGADICDPPAAMSPDYSTSTNSTSEVEGATERWSEGLDEETEFWFRWLRDYGGPWPDDYRLRTDPDSELQPHIRQYLEPSAPNGRLRILDVGSGPLTVLGKRWDDRVLEIMAVDPLAERYAELFARVGLEPLVRPVRGEAEQVAELFPPASFDLVYAQNCIDHGYDPLRSIQQMLTLVKPDRVLLLEHAIDEGEYMRYAGPHQWNFRAEDGRFVIWRAGMRVDAHSILEPDADLQIESLPESRWIRVALRKRA